MVNGVDGHSFRLLDSNLTGHAETSGWKTFDLGKACKVKTLLDVSTEFKSSCSEALIKLS